MKMKSKSAWVAMAAIVLASCSQSELIEQANIDSNEIMASSAVSVASVNTRASYEGTISGTNKLKALVLASETSKDYSTMYCAGTMEFADQTNAVDFDKPLFVGTSVYPNSAKVYLTGLHPAGTINAPIWDLTTTSGSASLTLTGKEDVMLAKEKESIKGGQKAALAFEHQLTLMKFFLYGDADAVTAKTKVTGLKLTAVDGQAIPNEVTVDLAAQTVSLAGSASDMPCYGTASDVAAFGTPYAVTATIPAPGTDTELAYVIAPAVTATGQTSGKDTYEYTFVVSYTLGDPVTATQNIEVKVNLKATDKSTDFAASTIGKAFNISLKFAGGQIQASASVTDWALAGNIDMQI